MDELMMDWLYEELDPARSARVAEHAGGCARCSAELASLRRTREAFREMPDLDPPPALSAILLHEAARRAPSAEAGAVVVAVPSDGDTGLWARIAAWLRPLALHPAATAACTIVLLAGVAGALYVRGGGEMAARTHMSSPDLPPPGDLGPAASGSAVAAQAPAEEDQPSQEEAPEPDKDDGLANKDGRLDPAAQPPSGFAAGVLDDEGQADLRAAQDQATLSLPRAAEQKLEASKERQKMRSGRKTAEKNLAQKGDVGGELDGERLGAAEEPRMELADKASPRGGYAVPPATTPVDRAVQPAAPPIATGSEAGGARGPTRGAPPKVARPEPSSRPADDAESEAAPPTAGASASTAPAETRTRAQVQWLSAQEKKIGSLTRSGKCREVAVVANDILDRDPSYYVRRVQATVLSGKCQGLVGAEQRRRATRRASKNVGGSQGKVKAATEPSESADAAESEKAQKE